MKTRFQALLAAAVSAALGGASASDLKPTPPAHWRGLGGQRSSLKGRPQNGTTHFAHASGAGPRECARRRRQMTGEPLPW
jgi:hypothetical protein